MRWSHWCEMRGVQHLFIFAATSTRSYVVVAGSPRARVLHGNRLGRAQRPRLPRFPRAWQLSTCGSHRWKSETFQPCSSCAGEWASQLALRVPNVRHKRGVVCVLMLPGTGARHLPACSPHNTNEITCQRACQLVCCRAHSTRVHPSCARARLSKNSLDDCEMQLASLESTKISDFWGLFPGSELLKNE